MLKWENLVLSQLWLKMILPVTFAQEQAKEEKLFLLDFSHVLWCVLTLENKSILDYLFLSV